MSKKRPSTAAVSRAIRPLIENLEGRLFLSATLESNGGLYIAGTAGNDVITIAPDTHKAGMLDATVDGKMTQYATSKVKAISVDAGAGNDKVTLAPNVMIKAAELGGTGNDSLTGGGGNDSINGGAGNDSINGGAGNDSLNGSTGNDTVSGGTGNDTVSGGGGDDKVDGGTGQNTVDTPWSSGVPLSTLSPAIQAGLTTLAQGAAIGNVTPFQDGGKTYYGTVVTIAGVNTRIVVDSTGKAISDTPADGGGGPVVTTNTTFGTVLSSTGTTLTLSVASEGGVTTQTTFTVTTATKITRADAPVTLASLVAGTLVHVQTSSNAPTVATSIWVVVPEVKTTASGPLVSVNTTADTITLGGDAGAMTTYSLDPSATVTLNGATSTLGALPIGSSVQLKLSSDGKTVLTVAASAENKTVSGPLVSVNTTADTITLGGDAGAMTTYPLDPAATITLNEVASSLGALPVGASVKLKLALDGKTALTVTASAENRTVSGRLVSVSTTANSITLGGDAGAMTTYPLDPNATITLNGVASTLGALPVGASVQLKLALDGKTALTVTASAENKTVSGPLLSVNTTADTITLGGDAGAMTTYPLDPNATITLNGAASSLGALPVGASVQLKLALDGKTALTVTATAENKTVSGPLVSVNTTADTITLGGDAGAMTTYPLDPNATITLNDAASTLGALPVGASVQLKLALDGKTALTVTASAENKTVSGPLVSVNTTADTITLGGDAGAQTTYPLDPNATITLNGVASSLGALPVGASVQLKLALDGKTALTVTASAENKTVSGPLVSVNTTADTITLGGDAGAQTTYPLDPNATITLNGVASSLGALPAGASVQLKLALDGKTALTVTATAQNKSTSGPLVSFNTTADTITLGGDAGTQKTYTLDPLATVKLNGVSTTLGALPMGASVQLTLTPNGLTVLAVTASVQVPQVTGTLVSADGTADTITLQGDHGPYAVNPSATVVLNGAASTLAALPVGAHVELTLSVGGAMVVSIAASTPH